MSDTKPRRIDRAHSLLKLLPTSEARQDLVDLVPELRTERQLRRDLLREVDGWPADDKPFLTPREFADYTRPLHARKCRVVTIDGQTITAVLMLARFGDFLSIDIGGHLLSSHVVADLVCLERPIPTYRHVADRQQPAPASEREPASQSEPVLQADH